MATASQKRMLMRFLVRMRGVLTAPPMIVDPVNSIPLVWLISALLSLYQAAPMMLSPKARAIPVADHTNGEILSNHIQIV